MRQLTRRGLMAIGYAARDKMLQCSAEGGSCQPVSEEIVRRLHKAGHKGAFEVFGSFDGHPHVWVRVGDWYIDATRDQFRHFAETEEEEADIEEHPVAVWRVGEDPRYV